MVKKKSNKTGEFVHRTESGKTDWDICEGSRHSGDGFGGIKNLCMKIS